MDFAELAAAARLLAVPVAALGVGLNRLAIGNLRLLGFDLHLVAPFEPLADNLQVQFAHAGDHEFLGLGIPIQMEGGIFLDDLGECPREFGFIAAALGRHRQSHHRRGELHRRQLQFTQHGSRVQFLHLGDGDDVARTGLVDRMCFGRLHLQQRIHLDALARRRCVTTASFFSVPLKRRMKLSFCTNGSIRVLNTCAVSGAGGVRLELDLAVALLGLARQIVGRQATGGERIEQFGQSHAGLAGAAQDGHQRAVGDRLDHQARQLFLRGLRSFEIPLHHGFVDFDD